MDRVDGVQETKIRQVESVCQLDKLETGHAMKDEKDLLESVHNCEVMVNSEQKDSYSRFPKRKRRRPTKFLDDGSIQIRAANRQNTAGADAYLINQKNVVSNGAELPMVKEVPLAADDSVPSQSTHQKPVKLMGEATSKYPSSAVHRKDRQSLKGIFGKRGRKKWKILSSAIMTVLDKPAPAQILTTNLPDQDPEDLTNGSVAGAVRYAAISESDDDKPLSTWFDGTQPPPKLDGTAGDLSSRCKEVMEKENQIASEAVGQSEEEAADNVTENGNPVEMGDELARRSTAIPPTVGNIQDLPFLKNSLVWKMVESMDVFRFLPQRPHFLPLYDCKEETREGLAIGNMVTFASLVEKVTKFQLEESMCVLDSSLETLVELERHGFDVNRVRARIKELISIKSGQGEALNTRVQLENQIVDLTVEKSRAGEEVAELDKKMVELQERRSLAAAIEERKNSEINVLRTSVEAINAAMDMSRTEFGRIAAAPW